MNTGEKARVDWVDIAKGICIIFVVMMHSVLGVEAEAGARGWMHPVVAFAQPFRMPDFFMISGLFLGIVIDRSWLRYADRKIVHFAYFYVLWLTIQFLFKAPGIVAQSGTGGALSAYLMAFIQPFGTLWFIYLLPVFFVVTRLVKGLNVWLVLAVAAVLETLPIHTGWLVVDEFCSRFVYFFAGYALAPEIFRLAEWLRQRPATALAILGAWALINGWLVFTPAPLPFAAWIPAEAATSGGLGGWASVPLISLAAGGAGALAIVSVSALIARLALSLEAAVKPLRWLGANSIVVYLAFFLPMAIARTILLKTGIITDIGTISLLTVISGVLGPVMLYWLIQWCGYGQFLFRRPQWAYIDRAPAPRGALASAE
ncbi:acyltransferase family protein [Phyllobacterium endophyticum]|uniref:Acyltransferase n=1 Tax=Phyllobacterium endophyticum TaxID=1149773 RepID=A0A2P7AZW5_9HYPH|nr:acyltransferase family protein [Phyllobacterium endophyticum]MBB3235608.1 putative membrane protein YcfT [Phyllobacterium endophyticum]PSH59766.1 acyltransferase [Phyllobacterium endophyticum]TYR41912.1 acyltransferase family protein [Phyllobacterium endophyticum]